MKKLLLYHYSASTDEYWMLKHCQMIGFLIECLDTTTMTYKMYQDKARRHGITYMNEKDFNEAISAE